MADKLKDADDLRLEAMFRSDPVVDDGFSARVESRIRRRQWVRRLTLPLAFVIGATIAAKPAMQLAGLVPKIVNFVPKSLFGNVELPIMGLLEAPTLLAGVVLLAGIIVFSSMLDEA